MKKVSMSEEPPSSKNNLDTYLCPGCKIVKPLDQFYKSKWTKWGHTYRCKKCIYQYACNWRKTHPEQKRKWERSRNQRVKYRVLSFYSGGKPTCKHCGFRDIRALSIDHIEGGGNIQRRLTHTTTGYKIYKWLEKQGYPKEFQVLCMNCQFIKREVNNEYRRE